MPDDPLKSAYELAMERLREKETEAGEVGRPLTDDQKQAIAGARTSCDAKLAELEILYRSKRARTADPEARRTLEEEYRRDVRRATDDRDRKVAAIRKGAPSGESS